MWLAEADPSVAGANLWFVLATTITTLGSLAAAWMSHRREKTARSSAAAVADEAVDEYRRLIAEPLAEERDDYRARWVKCEEDRRGRRRD